MILGKQMIIDHLPIRKKYINTAHKQLRLIGKQSKGRGLVKATSQETLFLSIKRENTYRERRSLSAAYVWFSLTLKFEKFWLFEACVVFSTGIVQLIDLTSLSLLALDNVSSLDNRETL